MSDPEDLSALMRAARKGDDEAYRRLLLRVATWLRAVASRGLAAAGRPNADCEDIVQETLLAMHLKRDTWDETQPLQPWLRAIARHKLVDHLRRSGRHAGALPLDDEAHQLAGPPEGAAADARLDLSRALDALPERTRRLIDQVKLQGASVAEAAGRAGMTETAAKVAIHRGLQAMAKFLSKRRTGP